MTSDPIKQFELEKEQAIERMGNDPQMTQLTRNWFDASCEHRYTYNFSWMGRPIIQYPQDMVAMQELIWQTKPDVIIETGIAHGGSLIFYASMLRLLGGERRIMGIDIDIREHNRREIEAHPMFELITLVQGSSVDDNTAAKAAEFARGAKSVMVILDSNHTHEHVLRELELYSPLVSKDNYLVVFDTVVEDMTAEAFPDRPWGPGDNPKTAVYEFLRHNTRFEIDKRIDQKLQITVAPDGYLKCIG